MSQVHVYNGALFFGVVGTEKQFALRTSHERTAPKVDAWRLLRRVWLKANTVNCHHRQSVSHGMCALYGCPSLALALLFGLIVAGGIANGGGVDKQVGSAHGHQSGCFGIPLVPTNQHAQSSNACVDGLKAQVARRKVKLLVVSRVVGDVHLTIHACHPAVFFHHHSRVMVKPWCSFLEQRGNNHYAMLLGQLAKKLC